VPKVECQTPLPVWKRLDAVQDVIDDKEKAKVALEGGIITMEEYEILLQKGEA
jgi:hypothetical protein